MASEGGGRDDRIRERAYQMWIEEGQPDGRAEHHWDEARRRLKTEDGGESVGLGDTDQIAADPAAAAIRSTGGKG